MKENRFNELVEPVESTKLLALFSMIPSTLTFEFDLFLGSFLHFGALIAYFLGWIRVQKMFLGLLM